MKQWTKLLGTSVRESGAGIAVHPTDNSCKAGEKEGDPDGENDVGLFDIFIWKLVGPQCGMPSKN
jgi:hypothetical protein